MTEDRKPPFVVDYSIDGRRFSFLLLGPTSWAEAETHLAAIGATGMVEGSDVVEIEAPHARALNIWVEQADALLAALLMAGRSDEMALTAAATMAASFVTAGLNRGEAAVAAAAMLDEVYAMKRHTPNG
jgi:hypothetical protein